MTWRVCRLPVAVLICAFVAAGCATTGQVDKKRAAEANAGLASDFLRKNQNDQALQRFRRALSYDSDNVAANWGMAIVSERLGESDRAREYYKKTLDLQPSSPIYNSYAAFLCSQGDTDDAVEYFDRAAKNSSYTGRAQALANAGLCLHRAGRADKAEHYYRRALEIEPAQFTALVHMARLQYDTGDYLRARAFIERADAASALDAEQLLLAARIELALDDSAAAQGYLDRHNAVDPSAAMSLRQLEQSR